MQCWVICILVSLSDLVAMIPVSYPTLLSTLAMQGRENRPSKLRRVFDLNVAERQDGLFLPP